VNLIYFVNVTLEKIISRLNTFMISEYTTKILNIPLQILSKQETLQMKFFMKKRIKKCKNI
jgi:hypothetical protein